MKSPSGTKKLRHLVLLLCCSWVIVGAWISSSLYTRSELLRATALLRKEGLNLHVDNRVLFKQWMLAIFPWRYARLECGLYRYQGYAPALIESLARAKIPEAIAAIPLIETSFRNEVDGENAGIWHTLSFGSKINGMVITDSADDRLDVTKDTDFSIKLIRDYYGYFSDWASVVVAYRMGTGFVFNALDKGETDAWKIASSSEPASDYLASYTLGAAFFILRTESKDSAVPTICKVF